VEKVRGGKVGGVASGMLGVSVVCGFRPGLFGSGVSISRDRGRMDRKERKGKCRS